jgi:hypothetical protein
MAVPIIEGGTDNAVARSQALRQLIFPFEIREVTAAETSGGMVVSGGCLALKFPLCRLVMICSGLEVPMAPWAASNLTQGWEGRNRSPIEPQNIEQGISNVEVWNRCALPFLS